MHFKNPNTLKLPITVYTEGDEIKEKGATRTTKTRYMLYTHQLNPQQYSKEGVFDVAQIAQQWLNVS